MTSLARFERRCDHRPRPGDPWPHLSTYDWGHFQGRITEWMVCYGRFFRLAYSTGYDLATGTEERATDLRERSRSPARRLPDEAPRAIGVVRAGAILLLVGDPEILSPRPMGYVPGPRKIRDEPQRRRRWYSSVGERRPPHRAVDQPHRWRGIGEPARVDVELLAAGAGDGDGVLDHRPHRFEGGGATAADPEAMNREEDGGGGGGLSPSESCTWLG